jgi:hypothetical protein
MARRFAAAGPGRFSAGPDRHPGPALLIALTRSHQPTALLGSVLLASIATLSVALPLRLTAFWQALLGPVGLLLWVPFATSVIVGPLLFAFFAVFPRQIWTTARMTLALIPAVIIVGRHLCGWHEIGRIPGPPTGHGRATFSA